MCVNTYKKPCELLIKFSEKYVEFDIFIWDIYLTFKCIRLSLCF